MSLSPTITLSIDLHSSSCRGALYPLSGFATASASGSLETTVMVLSEVIEAQDSSSIIVPPMNETTEGRVLNGNGVQTPVGFELDRLHFLNCTAAGTQGITSNGSASEVIPVWRSRGPPTSRTSSGLKHKRLPQNVSQMSANKTPTLQGSKILGSVNNPAPASHTTSVPTANVAYPINTNSNTAMYCIPHSQGLNAAPAAPANPR